jgi:biopolymer transport protein ExbB
METWSFLIKTIVESFKANPVWIITIGIVFAFAIAIALERLFKLKSLDMDGRSFMFEIQKYILANDLDGAIRACNAAPNRAVPRIVRAGLQRASRNEEQIQNAIDAASLEVIPQLERKLPYLATIANIATLIGLLGTISGLVSSFGALEAAEPSVRQAILGRGISEAMVATALGLLTAIFAMSMHSILANRATKVMEEIDEFGVKLMDLLSARKYRHSSEKGAVD